jgi:hypothetical protein
MAAICDAETYTSGDAMDIVDGDVKRTWTPESALAALPFLSSWSVTSPGGPIEDPKMTTISPGATGPAE